MPNTEKENNQSEAQAKKKLELLRTKSPLERAQERLRKTRLDEEETISKPQTGREEPSPTEVPAKPKPAIPEPSEKTKPLEKAEQPVQPTAPPPPTPRVSKEQAEQELEQVLEEKPVPEKPQEPEVEKEIKPSYGKPRPETAPPQKEEEKLEFLKRKEVKTMQKDIKSLRELEAKKERARIIGIQAEKKKKIEQEAKTEAKKPESAKKPLPGEVVIPKPPKRPSPLKKVFVRVGIFVLVAFVATFIYWFFSQKQKLGVEEEAPYQEEEITEEVEEPEISIPESLIAVKDSLTFDATSSEDVRNIYNQIITQELTENEFTRIIIKNEKEKYLLSLNEIAQAFQIAIPEEILENLETDTLSLLAYPQKEGKRAVVIVEIKDEEKLKAGLTDWENDIIANGLSISGNKIPTASAEFKDYSFENVPFRFLTISMNDLGICYVIFDDYFALSTSFKGIEETIKALKEQSLITELKNKAGQLFIVGFEGKTVTDELEQFFRKYRPGGVLLLSENIEGEEQLKSLTNDLQALSIKETGLPLLIAVDQEGGSISRIEFLKEKTAQSEIPSQNYAYAVGLKRGEELKELGVNLNLSPVLDNAQSSDFIYKRSFQKTVSVSGELAESLITGQKEAGILTAVKHFPGYVNIIFNPEDKLATTNLPETSQFKKALDAEPEMVMISNAVYQDLDSAMPFSFSSSSIEFLKNELGPDILIVSDDLSQNSLLDNFTLNQIVTNPVSAGVDMLIFSGWRSSVEQALDEFLKAIEQKQISEQMINSAFSRINQLKQKLEQ
jgi:beta-N-acetylhexosaminidase